MASSRRRSRASARTAGRDERVDALRGIALVHITPWLCWPGAGAYGLADLARQTCLPLFALLIGVGAQVADAGAKALPAAFVRAGIRAFVLVVLSVWAWRWADAVDVVLTALALPVLLAPLLARLRSSVLLGVAVALWAAGPYLHGVLAHRAQTALARGDDLGVRLWDALFVGSHARATTVLVFTCLGIVVWRLCQGSAASRDTVGAAIAALVLGAMTWAARLDGRIAFGPYDDSRVGTFCAVMLVGGFADLWLGAGKMIQPPAWLTVPGAMTLSTYLVQVAALAAMSRGSGGAQSVTNTAVVMIAAVIFPLLWRAWVPRAPWSAGPIEGPMRAVTRLFR